MMIESKTAYSYLIEHMESPSFKKVRDIACDFVRKLPTELCDELYESLNRGVDALDSEPSLQMYFYAFGDMHVAKLEYAFDHLRPALWKEKEIEIVDYGCGQGLATLCLHDFIFKNNLPVEVRKIVLIEPSEMALKRAALLCSRFFPDADIETISKSFEDLTIEDLNLSKDTPTIQLFSNVLDVDSYQIETFSDIVRSASVGVNEYVIVSPVINVQRTNRIKEFESDLGLAPYFRRILDKYELREDKEWTCVVSLSTSHKRLSIRSNNLDEIIKESSFIVSERIQDKDACDLAFSKLFEHAVLGEKRCQNLLGLFYSHGIGTETDDNEAFKWFSKSADQGYLPAMGNLVGCYFGGKGTEKSEEKAVELLKRLYKAGYVNSYHKLAGCYFKGLVVEKDIEQAIRILKEACTKNGVDAMYCLGMIYVTGDNVEKDFTKGLTYLKAAAERGSVKANRIMGNLYLKGKGVKKDVAKAVSCYTYAGSRYDRGAMIALIDVFNDKQNEHLFGNDQYDVFVKAVRLQLQEAHLIARTALNTEPNAVTDGEVVYSKDGFRLIRTVTHYYLSDFEKQLDIPIFPHAEKHLVKSIIKDGVRVICDRAFAGCNRMTDLSLPISLNIIGTGAFAGCINLDRIDVPNSVVYIGRNAFNCDGAILDGKKKNPLEITIPPSVEMIDGNPFGYNTIIKSENKRYNVIDNVLYNADGTKLISYCRPEKSFVVPMGVKTIGIGAFADTPIEEIWFPNSVEIIESGAFSGCNKLKSIVFPSSLKEIHEDAFHLCHFENNAVSLPASIETISEKAFGFGWEVLCVIVPKGRVDHYKSVLPKWFSEQICDEKVIMNNGLCLSISGEEVIAAKRTIENIVIPEGVIRVRAHSLDTEYTIESLKIPSSLESIHKNAFDEEVIIRRLLVPQGKKEYFGALLDGLYETIEEW